MVNLKQDFFGVWLLAMFPVAVLKRSGQTFLHVTDVREVVLKTTKLCCEPQLIIEGGATG